MQNLIYIFIIFIVGSAFAGTDQLTNFKGNLKFTRSTENTKWAHYKMSAEIVNARAAAAVNYYLKQYNKTYRLPQDKPNFGPALTMKAGDPSYPHFCKHIPQVFNDKPITGAGVIICFTPDAIAQDNFPLICDEQCLAKAEETNLDPPTAALIAPQKLREMIGNEKFGRTSPNLVDAQPVWIEKNGSLVSGYRVSIETTAPYGRYVAYLNGATGEIVSYENLILFDSVKANAYPRDRLEPWKEVDLEDLITTKDLITPYVRVVNAQTNTVLSRPNGDYRFQPEDSEFAQTQVAYAAQIFMPKFIDWGFVTPTQMKINVHYGEKYNNAFYDGRDIYLGDGDGEELIQIPYDNTVVTHEYGHYIFDTLSHTKTMADFGDGAALHEGNSDYLTCSVYNSPSLGKAAMPDGEDMRSCDTNISFTMRDTIKEEHDAGQIWSGALWEARRELGPNVMDPLLIHSMMRIRPKGYLGTTRMEDAFSALLTADKSLYEDPEEHDHHVKTLIEIFVTRRGLPMPTAEVLATN